MNTDAPRENFGFLDFASHDDANMVLRASRYEKLDRLYQRKTF